MYKGKSPYQSFITYMNWTGQAPAEHNLQQKFSEYGGTSQPPSEYHLCFIFSKSRYLVFNVLYFYYILCCISNFVTKNFIFLGLFFEGLGLSHFLLVLLGDSFFREEFTNHTRVIFIFLIGLAFAFPFPIRVNYFLEISNSYYFIISLPQLASKFIFIDLRTSRLSINVAFPNLF